MKRRPFGELVNARRHQRPRLSASGQLHDTFSRCSLYITLLLVFLRTVSQPHLTDECVCSVHC